MKKLTLGKNNKGFSLVELIIVIAIMAVLTAVLAPQLLKYVERSREAKDDVLIDEINRAIMFALADETVSSSVAGTGFTVTIGTAAGGKTPLTVAGSVNADGAKAIAKEMGSTLGGEVANAVVTIPSALSSRAWLATTAGKAFTVTYAGGSYNIANPAKATS